MPVCYAGMERQARGGCIANLIISQQQPPASTEHDTQQHLYTFTRASSAAGSSVDVQGVAALGFAAGDMALLSLEGRQAAVGRISVHAVTQVRRCSMCLKAILKASTCKPALSSVMTWGSRIVGTSMLCCIGVQLLVRRVPTHANLSVDKTFALLPMQDNITVASRKPLPLDRYAAQCSSSGSTTTQRCALWRLDKDEFASAPMQQRTNVMTLVSSTSPRVQRLRQLLIDLEPPRPKSTVAAQLRIAAAER